MSDFELPSADEFGQVALASDSPPTRRKPRVWTVFLAAVMAVVLSVAAQAAVGALLAMRLVAKGVDPQDVAERVVPMMMSPPVFITLLIVSQLMFAATALIFARRSAEPLRQRIGWLPARCPSWSYALFPLGSLLPLLIGLSAAYLMTNFFEPDQSVEVLYEQMTTLWAIPFIVLIGLIPGVVEEMLFRGYIQRRLIQRWGPATGIFVTSVVFAICHISPHAIALAFVLGIWLGVLAWRTGSIWPSILCHAFVNSGWNVWQVGHYLWGFPDRVSSPVAVAGAGLMIVAFTLAIWVLIKLDRQVSHASQRFGERS